MIIQWSCIARARRLYYIDISLFFATHLVAGELSIPIGEISDISGFNSRNTFTENFHRTFGMSPSEYRKASKENQK